MKIKNNCFNSFMKNEIIFLDFVFNKKHHRNVKDTLNN